MKSLNDYIWNDEHFDTESASLDSRVSSTPLLGYECNDGTIPAAVCGGAEPVGDICATPNPPLPTSNCPTIDPLKINGCILPMGVSCGGGGVGVGTTVGCITPSMGAGDFCFQ